MALIDPNNPKGANLSEQQQMAKLAKILQTSPDMECESCQGKNFIQVYRIKKVSGLITGTGRDMVAPVSIYACAKCGNVNKYFLDKFNDTEEEPEKK